MGTASFVRAFVQLDLVLAGKPRKPPDRRMQKHRVGREADGLRLHRGVHRDPLEVLGA